MGSLIPIFTKATELLQSGENIVMVTVFDVKGNTPARKGAKMIIRTGDRPVGTIGGGALETHAQTVGAELFKTQEYKVETYDLGQLGMKCGGSVQLIYEFMEGTENFVLFGGGHVASALAPILESLGFRAIVMDNRESIIQTHEQTGRTAILCSYEDITPCSEYFSSGYVFIATHGHAFDTVVLEQVLRSESSFKYAGMIGSKSKVTAAFNALKEKGLNIPSYVYAPVGLDLGGDTPAEIAVSIASEIISLRYGKETPHMRNSVS